ncbi:hypothetical protein LAZ67_1008258 [Cordylochernes scorpioides]|uniref:Uncharacterized protein n=1 Tax=Cordylochernes scorpioides TaxID=51811 RepID=A0ABY6K2W1_9ARAC|nr:hypothetical protein LAZ67_1008258 [Cordylochernes scorpioides]
MATQSERYKRGRPAMRWLEEVKKTTGMSLDELRFLCLPSYTPGYILRAETGRNSLDITVKKLTLKFWTRILKMDGSRLPSICLAHLWDISISSKQNIGLRINHVSLLKTKTIKCTLCNGEFSLDFPHYMFYCTAMEEEREILRQETGYNSNSPYVLMAKVVKSRPFAFAFYKYWKSAQPKYLAQTPDPTR